MPIFSRRRLQAMLNDLTLLVDAHKLNDLKARLENKRTSQAVPAEFELGVLWTLSTMGELEVEPDWYGARCPDAYTECLFEGRPCAVEITAISDARLSQEEDMRRVATRLCEIANKFRKGFGKHLHFQFAETSGYTEKGYMRRRLVDKDFAPTEITTEQLRAWLALQENRQPLKLQQGGTHVTVTWHALRQHQQFNFFSSMPAEAYSLKDNPLYEALTEKARQLASPGFTGLRCIIVADAGSCMLRDQESMMRTHGTVTAREVVEHFLLKAAEAVDVVLLLSPYRNNLNIYHREPIRWRFTGFARLGIELSDSGVKKLAASLPPARFEGYQARALQQQAAFRYDARGWYVGTTITSGRSHMTIKLSARALLDLLAGRITIENFQDFTGLGDKSGQPNIFKHRLEQGDILSDVKIEPGGIDEDDDWLVIELKQDPSAAPLRSK